MLWVGGTTSTLHSSASESFPLSQPEAPRNSGNSRTFLPALPLSAGSGLLQEENPLGNTALGTTAALQLFSDALCCWSERQIWGRCVQIIISSLEIGTSFWSWQSCSKALVKPDRRAPVLPPKVYLEWLSEPQSSLQAFPCTNTRQQRAAVKHY